ncbi:MAG TPA: hypothetical protein VKV17_21145 [Bryobacteraceae bacterium]|nr:hypothetical protein [Bryobacteraceae bacterium]
MRFAAALALALVPGCLYGQSAFRATSWGMNEEQVRAAEKSPPVSARTSKGELFLEFHSARLGPVAGRMIYIFAQNQLVRARFLPDADHADRNEYIRDFQTVEAELKQRYGKPVQDRTIWIDDSTQDEPKSYLEQDRATATGILPSDRHVGLAVLLGHLRLYTQRTQGPTEIWHTLWGEDRQITHQVEYQSVALRPLDRGRF